MVLFHTATRHTHTPSTLWWNGDRVTDCCLTLRVGRMLPDEPEDMAAKAMYTDERMLLSEAVRFVMQQRESDARDHVETGMYPMVSAF